MMTSRPATGRHHRLYAYAAILSLVLAVIFGLYGFADQRSEMRIAAADARLIAEQTARATEGALDAMRQLLRAMRVLVEARRDSITVDASLRDWVADNKYLMDLLVLSGDGRITAWTGRGERPDVTDRDYYRAHVNGAGSRLYVGLPLRSKVHPGKWFFAISEDVRDADGNLTGVVVAIIDIALLKRHLAVPLPSTESTQTLFGRGGEVYARQPDHDAMVGKRVDLGALSEAVEALAAGTAVELRSPLDGKTRIAFAARVGTYPLFAVGSLTRQAALDAWHRRLMLVVLLWLTLSIAILLVARSQVRNLVLQEKLARTDALTGVHNRRAILEAAGAMGESPAGARTLALAMIDADHFKRINDTHGHAAGDEVLRRLSDTLRSQCRTTDLVGRYGGEEFLVLMPDTDLVGARVLAEKIRVAVEALPPEPVPISVSIGVAATAPGRDLQQALLAADRALYEAKAAGRNCVRVAGDPVLS